MAGAINSGKLDPSHRLRGAWYNEHIVHAARHQSNKGRTMNCRILPATVLAPVVSSTLAASKPLANIPLKCGFHQVMQKS